MNKTNLHAGIKIDAYYIGYPKTASTTIEFALHYHPEIKQLFKTRLFVYDEYYEYYKNRATNLFNSDNRIIVESDEALISQVFFNYRTAIERAYMCNKDLKIIISLRNQVDRIMSSYRYDICGDEGFSTFKKWSQGLTGVGVINRSNYYREIKYIFDTIPRDQVYIMLYEQFLSNPVEELNKLFNFLGVSKLPKRYSLDMFNITPSPISVLMVSLINKLLYPVCYARNHKNKLYLLYIRIQ